MKVVISGCRDYNDYDVAKEYIEGCFSNVGSKEEITILSGGSKGADALGERYAKERGLKIERYPANWDFFGKRAGPVRNMEMAQKCDFVICFWDGKSRGTKSMIECAKRCKKPAMIKMI